MLKTNPGLTVIFAWLVALAISLKASLTANLLVCAVSVILLLLGHLSFKKWLLALLLPLPAFLALYFALANAGHWYASTIASRCYAYVLSGTCLTHFVDRVQLARSLTQNFHLAPKFAYGVLAATDLFPLMAAEVKQLKAAGLMRGVHLAWYSPTLYFKAILLAWQHADSLALGMQSHGFRDDAPRSTIVPVALTKKDWCLFGASLLLFLVVLFVFK